MRNIVRQSFLITSLFAVVATGTALVAPNAFAQEINTGSTGSVNIGGTFDFTSIMTGSAGPVVPDAPATDAPATDAPATDAPATDAVPAVPSDPSIVSTDLTQAAAATAAVTPCTNVDVVVARGTGENGTLGTIAGDPFYAALKKAAPTKTFSAYAVNYPASLALDSAEKGNVDLVNHVTAQAAACPAQKFVLMGYSQGANVVGNSVGVSSDGAVVGAKIKAQLTAATGTKVSSIVLFGYPNDKRHITITGVYGARTDDVCAKNDIICDPAGLDISAHLSYNSSGAVAKAALFAAPLL